MAHAERALSLGLLEFIQMHRVVILAIQNQNDGANDDATNSSVLQ